MLLTDKILTEIRQHAAIEYLNRDSRNMPRESCGLVVVHKGKYQYVPCKNIAESNEHFVLDPVDYANAEDAGEVVLVVHSHPDIPPDPSQADLVGCEASGLPWLIVNWPTGVTFQFEPSGFTAPLYGRVFAHGILDCYAFIRDYYRLNLAITLPDFNRQDEWWLKGRNLYTDNFQVAGFNLVNGPKKEHDVLLLQVGSPVPNHGVVVLGDGCIGHHQMGRLSSRDVYGGWFEKCATHHLRHKDLL
jgi:proteasome lid subunit RPN8/RPN11